MSHNDYLTFEEFNRRSTTPSTHTTPAAVGIAVIAGVATLFRFLDFLGYPVWFWIRQFAHKMALELVRAVSPTPSLDSVASDDTTQSGGMMGSLFGMGASALSKGVRGVASALSRGPSDVPPGLGNYDNSCYQNSVIQGLASLPSLRSYLEETTAEHKSFTSETTNGALLEMISQLNDPEKRGQHFWIRGKLKSMSTFTQQDAQEYYSRILDELDKELKKATPSKGRSAASRVDSSLPELGSKEKDGKETDGKEETADEKSETEQSNTTPIPLEGSLAQRVGCTTCGYSEGLSLIPFNCITVSLGRNRSGYDIRELLDEHTGLEYIEGVECSKCTLLKKKATLDSLIAIKGPIPLFTTQLQAIQEALDDEDLKDTTMTKKLNIPKKNWIKSEKSKQVAIARAPKSLVLHINRSIFDETTFSQYKNNAGVAYPSTLDLGKWCLGTKPSGSQKPDLDPKTEAWPRDPKESMLAGADDTTPSPFQYRLRAAVTHFGTHGNGHYVCYRPHPRLVRKAVEEKKEDDNDADEADIDSEGVEADGGEEKQQPQDGEVDEQSQSEDEEDEEEGEEEAPPLPSEQWYRFSDDTVYAIPEREAHQGNVFMLFYERIDEDESSPHPSATQPVTDSAPLRSSTSADKAAESTILKDGKTADSIPSQDDTAQAQPPVIASEKGVEGIPSAEASEATKDRESSEVKAEAEAEADSHSESDATTTTPAKATAATTTAPASSPTPPQLSPHTMRTAGNKAARGQGSRKSLPLVSAT